MYPLLLPANKVLGKVMFSQVFVCPQGGGWLRNMHYRSHDQEGLRPGESVSRGVCIRGTLHPGGG